MINTIPFNLRCKYGEDLREIPEYPGGFKKSIKYLEAKVNSEPSDEERGKILSTLGVLKRIMSRPEESLPLLDEAAQLFERCGNKKLSLINDVRKAVSFQFLDRHADAETLYKEVEEYILAHPRHFGLLDFVYQHRGKNEFDQGNYDKAMQAFRKALELRRKKGRQELIGSTNFAINITQKHLGES